ncbi:MULTISPECIES: Holliday junction resolvase RecU [unclassified Dehalobacter]|uniref:Holliday junction resolvase RecU n=1 Tax=unclassified Dehalobacter TaxID=2635733 RepID=UPI00104D0DA0|nr:MULTISPECIES: Holliday junction resolvase RecU [unclassified Dehalobacter]TCX51964.1 Holliday junction resolvase [Dehalobacter sp. 14DCB1]TCX53024.1 Holliday junction resolvase [Dehalobacter sp. 12DCB1]
MTHIQPAPKNFRMANKGVLFEQEIMITNEAYRQKGIALIQKISTPWKVIRRGNQIVKAFPEGKSTLDFRGTVKGGFSVSFDCKESEDGRGLPLSYIEPHQIDYIREALAMNEMSFILCLIKPMDKRYLIPGALVLEHWDFWQRNKGKRNANYIAVEDMIEVRSARGILLDYLPGLEGIR